MPRGRAPVSRMPAANMAVNTMPIDESSLVRLNRLTTLMSTLASRPAIMAPASSGTGFVSPVTMKVSTTPGRMACERASPMRAICRRTTKQPSTPQVTATRMLQAVPIQ